MVDELYKIELFELYLLIGYMVGSGVRLQVYRPVNCIVTLVVIKDSIVHLPVYLPVTRLIYVYGHILELHPSEKKWGI